MRRLLLLTAFIGSVVMSGESRADDDFIMGRVVYQVQIEYWQWDTDVQFWKTVYETYSPEEADAILDLAIVSLEAGNLDVFFRPDYWKHIPIDVRMHYKIESLPEQPKSKWFSIKPSSKTLLMPK